MNQKTLVTGFVLLVVLPLAILAGIYFWMQPGRQLAENTNTTASGDNLPEENRAVEPKSRQKEPEAPVVRSKADDVAASRNNNENEDAKGSAPTQEAGKSTNLNQTNPPQETTNASSGSTPPPASMKATGATDFKFEKAVKETFESEHVRVVFPDTMEVMKDGKKIRVRLESVASPRKGQPFHEDARQFVEELIANSPAQVHQTGDSRGMLYGYVIVDGKNIGNEMLNNGFGWHYKRVSKSAELAKLENDARQAKRGLWADENPTPPWDWKQ